MEAYLANRMSLAAALVATACAGPEEPRYEGDYTSCDVATIDALPQNPSAAGTQGDGQYLVCGTEDWIDFSPMVESGCLEGSDSLDNWAQFVSSGLGIEEVLCGPMWLDGACCVMVEAVVIDAEDSDDTYGRPFLVHQRTRTARTAPGSGWTAPMVARQVPEDVRPLLVDTWVAIGLAEHASVAAFSRFALVLLHLGAPADLVADAHAAALDEVRHARLAFGLASQYNGATLSPGPLDASGALDGELDRHRIVETLIDEGCIGETVAALEATEAARQADDPVVAGILRQIAEDEARHADLAWRSLRWLLSRSPELAPVVQARIALRAVARVVHAGPDTARFGHLGPVRREVVRRAGLGAVVVPLAHAVLAEVRAA